MEQFIYYPELKWMAAASTNFYEGNDIFQNTPNINNFKLERFRYVMNKSNNENKNSPKLMLIDNNTTIFIYGPDSLTKILYVHLSEYKGRSWFDICSIKFEKLIDKCGNFLKADCNPWVKDKFMMKRIAPNEKVQYYDICNLRRADDFCVNCENFIVDENIKI